MLIRSAPVGSLVGALAVTLIGCTVAQPPQSRTELDTLTKRENLPGKPGCFWKSNFQVDWTVLNDTTLLVRAPLPKDVYVIKLFEPVIDLSFRQRLGFEDKEHNGQICNNGDDYLVLADWQRRVPIVAVHALTVAEQNQLLQAAGKPVPRQHAAAASSAPAS